MAGSVFVAPEGTDTAEVRGGWLEKPRSAFSAWQN